MKGKPFVQVEVPVSERRDPAVEMPADGETVTIFLAAENLDTHARWTGTIWFGEGREIATSEIAWWAVLGKGYGFMPIAAA